MMLNELSRAEMQALEKIARVRTFAQDTNIIREGETGSSFFLLLSGHAEVRKNIGLVSFRKLVDFGPCHVFGEICFLGVPHRTATVVATEECKVLEFHRTEFEAFAAKNPQLGLKLYRGIAQELADRLIRNNEELRKAILWALDEMRQRNEISLSQSTITKLAADAAEALRGAPDTPTLGIDFTKQTT